MGETTVVVPRPFQCEVCTRCFTRHHDMSRHMVSHRKKKGHCCPHCQREFSRADAVTRHIRKNKGICDRKQDNKDDSESTGSVDPESPSPPSELRLPVPLPASSNSVTPTKMGFLTTMTPGQTPVATSLGAPLIDIRTVPQIELKAHGYFHEHRPNLIGPPFQPMPVATQPNGLHGSMHGCMHGRMHGECPETLQVISKLEARVKMLERRLYLCESRLAEAESLRYDHSKAFFLAAHPLMSAASAPGLGSGFRPVPPQRGSFPLDHDGDCTHIVTSYLSCLKLVDGNNAPNCRELAKRYLKCRMDNDLMDEDRMENLGFQEKK